MGIKVKLKIFITTAFIAFGSFSGGSVFAQAHAQTSSVEVLNADVKIEWNAPTRVLPGGERGLLYPGEQVQLSGRGQIDRNHTHEEHDETVFLLIKKRKIVDHPNFVNYADHPMYFSMARGEPPTPINNAPTVLPSSGRTVQVPGSVNEPPVVLLAYIPDTPVRIERHRSYGAYQLVVSIDTRGRLALVENALKTARYTAAELRAPQFLNRRLTVTHAREVSKAVVVQYSNFHSSKDADHSAAEDIIELAIELDPANSSARTALADVYIAGGQPERAEGALKVAVEMLTKQVRGSKSSKTFRELAVAQLKLASVIENKHGSLDPRHLANAEFWFGEAGASFATAGMISESSRAYREQARVLVRIRSEAALEKARRVLRIATELAPSGMAGVFAGASPDGKLLALSNHASGFTTVNADGSNERQQVFSEFPGARVIGVDIADGKVLLRSDQTLAWWKSDSRQPPQPVRDDFPRLERAVVRNGTVVGISAEGKVLYIAKDKAPLVIRELRTPPQTFQGVGQPIDTVLGMYLNADDWLAISVLSSDPTTFSTSTSLEIYRPDGALDRKIGFQSVLSRDAPDKALDSGANPDERRLSVPLFVSLDRAGNALTYLSDRYQPWEARWVLYERSQARERTIELPDASPLAGTAPVLQGMAENWAGSISRTIKNPPQKSWRTYWWADGGDARDEWTHGSFTPDGSRIVLSNAIAGLLVIDVASGTMLRTIGLPRQTPGVAKAGARPLGHRWIDVRRVLVAGATAIEGTLQELWIALVDVESGEIREVPINERGAALFLRLGDPKSAETVVMHSDSPIRFSETIVQSLALVDRATRNAKHKSVFGTTPWRVHEFDSYQRPLLLDAGLVIQPSDKSVFVVDPRTGQQTRHQTESNMVVVHGPVPNSWFAIDVLGYSDRPGGSIYQFDGVALVGRAKFASEHVSSKTVLHLFDHHVLLNEPSSPVIHWYDLSSMNAVHPKRAASNTFKLLDNGFEHGEVQGFSAKDGVGIVILKARNLMPGRNAVWLQTTGGDTRIIAASPTFVPQADRLDLTVGVAASANQGKLLVKTTWSQYRSRFFGAKELLGLDAALIQVHPDLTIRKLTMPEEIRPHEHSRFNVDAALETAIQSGESESFVFDVQSGRLLARLDSSSRVADLTRRSVITSSGRGFDVWQLPIPAQ